MFDKNSLGSSRDIVLLLQYYSIEYLLQLLFSDGLSRVKYQEFLRFSIVCLPRKFTVLACCFDWLRAEIRLSFDI